MAVQVFVSHTQKDIEFCDIFDRACARVGVKAFRSEFEKIILPAWDTIRKAIRDSRALFLLVGTELTRSQAIGGQSWWYTQNWIAYEIGVACDRDIDVWVVCDDVRINFPVPYLNNYLPVSIRNREAFEFITGILRKYAQGVRTTFPDKECLFQCPYEHCGGIYNVRVRYSRGQKTVCPQCLGEIEFVRDFPEQG